jgi:hypothetical protein
VANDSIGASAQGTLAYHTSHTTLEDSACHTQLLLDGGAILAEWPENQQEAFFRAAGSAQTDRQQILMAVATLKMLQRVHFQRAETDFLKEKCLTVEGLPRMYLPMDVGRLLHLIDNELDAMTVAEQTTTLKPLYDRFGNPSGSCTAVLYEFRATKPMLDFIERRTDGPPAAKNIFFRRGTPEISGWTVLTVAQKPKIQKILKMLWLCGFSKPQAEHTILCCINRAIETETSLQVKAV